MAPYPFGAGVSEEEAVRIIQAERDNLDLAQSIIEAEGIDVEFWRGDLCEAHLSDGQSRTQLKNYRAWLKARVKYGLPEDSHQTLFVEDQEEARKVRSVFRSFNRVSSSDPLLLPSRRSPG